MFGRRADGRRLNNIDPIIQFTPYIMPTRNDASNQITVNIDYEPMADYIRTRSKQGVKITFMDLIIAQKDLERGGTHSVLPEMTMEYACIFAARASGKPVEFFQSMRPRDAIKVKAAVTNFLYGQE